MKVLHISTSDTAGAGLCCLRIHKAMLDHGINSKMVVLIRTSRMVPEVYQYGSIFDKIYRYLSKAFRLLGLTITVRNKLMRLARIYKTTYTSPLSYIDLSRCDLVKWADIIHLHWVNNYLDYPSFFKEVNKPIVWTLHDENLFYGIAHHHKSILFNNQLEIIYREIKQNSILKAKNLNIVFLSHMMQNTFGHNCLVKDRLQTVINNSVDGSVFFPLDKNTMREKYGLNKHKIIFLFIANDICDPNKGLDILSQSISEMNEERIMILAIGNNTGKRTWPQTQCIGGVYDNRILREYISLADYFALPSYQEAFSQSPLEAMACGIPVLAFPVSGTEELINENNGIICEDFTINGLKRGIEVIIRQKYDSSIIRENVLTRFSPDAITEQYLAFYNLIKK